MTIRAYAYAGGIIGSCEPQTKMKVEHCLNAGGFDRPAEDTFPDSKLKTGVDMVSYLQAQKYTDAAKALSDELGSSELRVSVIGGVIGVNGENQVIDHCASKGTMNGLNAMGGVVGLNEGIIRDCTLSGSMGSATQDYIGGIAGLNVGSRTARLKTARPRKTALSPDGTRSAASSAIISAAAGYRTIPAAPMSTVQAVSAVLRAKTAV